MKFNVGDEVTNNLGWEGIVAVSGQQTLGEMFPVIVVWKVYGKQMFRVDGTWAAFGRKSDYDLILVKKK